jgi:hypothetical protein
MASKDDEHRSALTDAAGRVAFYPARAAARAWRGPLEEAVDEVLSAPEIARVLDRALAGSLPEEFARSLVRHRVLERIAAELAASGELERLVNAALASPQTLELTDKVLASDQTQRALGHVASSPELRDAIARQTTGLADEAVGGVRASAARLDDRAGTYFVLFWSSAGQTPGMRLFRVRVHGPAGDPPSLGRSLVRLVGLMLAIVPMFAGFIPVFFTERRRGLPDFLAGTVVLYDDTRA